MGSSTGYGLGLTQHTIPAAAPPPPGPPFAAGSALNGLSLDAASAIVLGQNSGAAGNPAQLISNREIPLNTFVIDFVTANGAVEIADVQLAIFNNGTGETNVFTPASIIITDPVNNRTNSQSAEFVFLNDVGGGVNNTMRAISNRVVSAATGQVGSLSFDEVFITDPIATLTGSLNSLRLQMTNQGTGFTAEVRPDQVALNDGTSLILGMQNKGATSLQIGDFGGTGNSTTIDILDGFGDIVLNASDGVTIRAGVGSNALTTENDPVVIHSSTGFSNSAGAALGTLGNSPVAGNPSKWLSIDDGGITRFIPAWS